MKLNSNNMTHKTAIELIQEERNIHEAHGFTSQHDDGHDRAQLTDAAMAYVYAGDSLQLAGKWNEETIYKPGQVALSIWPFEKDEFRPNEFDPIQNYVKGAALLAAEIDRLLRKERNAINNAH